MLLLATLIAYAPVLRYGYPANAWDSRYNAVSGWLFSQQLWSGDLYPRWLIGMNSGLGSPHFFYYPPLGYYIASVFDWFGAPTAVLQLGAAACVLGFTSGVTCYLWLARLMPRFAALTGAVFYLASPFHVFVDLFVRADYSEFAAMTFTPLALLGVELLRERKSAGISLIALGFAAVVTTHVLVGMMFAAVPPVYALARGGFQPGWPRSAALVLTASLLGLGITGFYLVPALLYRPDVTMPVSTVGMPTESFVFGALDQPTLVLFVDAMFIGYLGLVVGMAVWWRRVAPARPRNVLFVIIFWLTILTLALTTVWARPLWLLFPVLWLLQFSWRLFVFIDLCVAALIGLFIANAVSHAAGRRLGIAAAIAILGMAACGGAVAVHTGLFDYNTTLWRERMRYTDDFGLFRPRAARAPLPADALPLYNGGVFGPDIPLPPKASIVSGDAEQQVVEWRPRHIVLRIEAKTAGRAMIGQLYVPGWRAIDLTSGQNVPITPSDGEGLLTVPFAAGSQQLSVSLTPRPPEYAGAVLSILSLVGLTALTAGARRRQARAPVIAGRSAPPRTR